MAVIPLPHYMDPRLEIWELLSKLDGDRLSKEEKTRLDDLLRRPENHPAFLKYQRLKYYWDHIAQYPGSKAEQNRWARHKDQFLERYLNPENAEQSKDQLIHDDYPAGLPITDESQEQSDPALINDHHLHHHTKRSIRSNIWIRIAALMVIAIGAGLLIKYFATPKQEAVIVQNGTQKHIRLPDGSQVWLNSGSQLNYNKNFLDNKIREVTLAGEAFFDIQHDPEHSFIIHTKYIDIKDIGTRFNVKAYPEDDKVETTLLKGEVEVYRRDAPTHIVRLKPNEKMVFNARLLKDPDDPGANPETTTPDPLDSAANSSVRNDKLGFSVSKLQPQDRGAGDSMLMETAWLKHQLVFNAQPFLDLARDMERWYDVNIHFENTVYGSYIFSGIFKGETVQEALSELQMIQHFQFEKNGKDIRIY